MELPSKPMGITDITAAMVNGTINGVDIMVFILVLGGLIGVVNASGAFESGLVALTKKDQGPRVSARVPRQHPYGARRHHLRPRGGGRRLLSDPRAHISRAGLRLHRLRRRDLPRRLHGHDVLDHQPFSVVIASNAAGVAWTEGIEWRVFGCIVGCIVVVSYLYWYCRKIKKNPAASYTYEDREHFAKLYAVHDSNSTSIPSFNWRRKVILVLFVLAFVLMVWGVVSQGWWFPQMAASFLAVAIIAMFLTGLDEKKPWSTPSSTARPRWSACRSSSASPAAST